MVNAFGYILLGALLLFFAWVAWKYKEVLICIGAIILGIYVPAIGIGMIVFLILAALVRIAEALEKKNE